MSGHKPAAAQFDHLFKILLIGDSGVGKTCLMFRFSDQKFQESYISTIGVDFKMKTLEVDGKKIRLQIWDTAGQERFRTITQAYYRGAMGILLIYDVTNANTWKNVRNWVRNIADNAPQTVNKILIGNKADMKPEMRQVSTAQGQSLADEYGMKFFETSARTGVNVAEAFLTLATDVKDRLLAGGGEPAPSGGINVAQAPEPTGRKSGCC